MLAIPAITAAVVIRERRLQSLESHVCATHDSLAHVVEAMDHVPVVVFLKLVTGCHAGVDGNDGVEAVKLVGH